MYIIFYRICLCCAKRCSPYHKHAISVLVTMTTELRQWWDEFRSRTDQQEQHIRFFKEHGKPLQLDNVHTMVSVGAGVLMFFPLSYFILFHNKCINVFFLKISHFKEGRGIYDSKLN